MARGSGERRRRRENRLTPHVAPLPLFVTGGLVIVSFLFQAELIARLCWASVFGALAVLAGKRLRWLYFVVMIGSITFFNLLTPVGRVLAELGPWVITEGALIQGLTKGVGIVGLVFISLFSVSPNLRLPGQIGGLLGRLFFYFERILDGKKQVSARHLVESLDRILLERFPMDGDAAPDLARDSSRGPDGTPGVNQVAGTTPFGWVIVGFLVGGSWATTLFV